MKDCSINIQMKVSEGMHSSSQDVSYQASEVPSLLFSQHLLKIASSFYVPLTYDWSVSYSLKIIELNYTGVLGSWFFIS